MSIATNETLRIGEMVELEPVIDGKAFATIRHKQGRIYGFEFHGLTPEHKDRIRIACRRFTPFFPRHLNI